MKLKQLFALGLLASAPAFASASNFLVDFENNWSYGTDVNGFYNGGSASDSSTGGANLGVEFVNVSGLSNDADFTYYTHAPSMVGTAYAHDNAFMNVAAGVDGNLSFAYSSPSAVIGAITAWSGLNGTGNLLGSFDLQANNTGVYDNWSQATFLFSGTAQSFNLTAAGANLVGLDNISSVPVPAAFWLLGSGLAMIGAVGRRGKSAV